MTTRSVLLSLASCTRQAAQQQCCWFSTTAASQSSIELVKQLRAQTGAPIGDIKKALQKTDNDVNAAIDALRTMGVAAAAKKATRSATEGLIGVATANGAAALVEVNCETDFVARSDQFMRLPRAIAAQALQCSQDRAAGAAGAVEVPLEELSACALEGGAMVADAVQEAAGVLRENVALRRAVTLRGGHVATYVHNALGPGVGSIGALVALESPALAGGAAVPPALAELGKTLAMQVAAMRPLCVTVDEVPPDMLKREKRVLADRAAAEGKSGPVVDKIVQGRLGKFYQEHVLLKQDYIMDDKATVQAVVKAAEAEVGAAVSVSGMAFLKVGGAGAQ